MIIESLLIVAFALGLDFAVGDPKNRFHPTAWIGKLIGRIIPSAKTNSSLSEKINGIIFVIFVTGLVSLILYTIDFGINLISLDVVGLIVSVIVGSILLKTTIAIRGMENHAMKVVNCIKNNDIQSARENLSMIVKRDTTELDKNHVLSGVLESVSENTVDGVTGPLLYFGLFGIFGAFAYRVVNTFDSMIGYKTQMFRNLGWFAANCDKILNYIPSRLTGLIMILGSFILRNDWKQSYQIMIRDNSKLESPNAGYPMAALAGALNTTFEKIDHYKIGDGNTELDISHIKSSIALMKVTSILFCGLVTVPIIVTLSYLGWWLHA